MSIKITGIEDVVAGLERWDGQKRRGLEILARTQIAPMLEKYAKENRPWTDRTGNARRGLTGSSEVTPTELCIRIAHTVHYGVYLEYMQAGRFAILGPTLDQNRQRILQIIEKFWEE